METTNRSPPKFIDGRGIHLWIALNASNAVLDRTKKILTQAGLLRFMPLIGVRDILFSIGSENNEINHGALVPVALLGPTYDQRMDVAESALRDDAAQLSFLLRWADLHLLERCCPKGLRQAEGALHD